MACFMRGAGTRQSGDRDMAGDASFEAEIKYRVNPRRRVIAGVVAIGLVVGVLTVLQLPARQLHLSGFWLEKGSYALVGGLGILLCWRAIKGYARCYVNLSLSLLRRAMFTMKMRLRTSASTDAGTIA